MIEYLKIAGDYALLIFSRSEWHALLMLVFVTSAITETAKRVFFIRMGKNKKKQYIYGTAFIVGLVAGAIGAYIGDPKISDWFWVVAAPIAGPVANMLHWLTMGVIAWKFPRLADTLTGNKPSAS